MMKYFDDVTTFGLNATCSSCGVLTFFAGQNRYRLEEKGINIVKYQYEFMCQDCGLLKMQDFEDASNKVLKVRCGCGGQYRRDKPLFCSSCKINKTTDNKSDPVDNKTTL